jgi:hydrogenase-1 operon protein HyaF
MARLHEITIVVDGFPPTLPLNSTPATSIVLAMLSEISTKLTNLATDGEESTIDLRCILGMPQEIALIRETLGQGEVQATVADIGSSQIRETALPCVWWISHQDSEGKSLGEFIEITEIPDLLKSNHRAIQRGLDELRTCCAKLEAPIPSMLPQQGNLS